MKLVDFINAFLALTFYGNSEPKPERQPEPKPERQPEPEPPERRKEPEYIPEHVEPDEPWPRK